jgi:hypothetical protein
MDSDYANWDRGNLRGLGHRRLVGRDKDPVTGQDVDVYELAEDEFEIAPTESQRHLTEHQTRYDPRCQYCNLNRRDF